MEIADTALSQVRNLSVNLRPPQLDLMGLEAALNWLLQRQVESSGLQVHFNAQLNAGARTPQADITCFRIVQEALTNVLRHAAAANLWVDIAETAGVIDLDIRDDGRGFDIDAAKTRSAQGRSLGLLSMEERITLMGGSFEIVSSPGNGTRIHAVIPV
jgi:two-component system sensor histidine kinase UhpB